MARDQSTIPAVYKVYLINITELGAPVTENTITLPVTAYNSYSNIVADSGLMLFQDSQLRVIVYDVSNPADPREVYIMDTAPAGGVLRVMDVLMHQGILYLSAFQYLYMYDLAVPSSPAHIGTYDSPKRVMTASVQDDNVYLGHGVEGISVIDVSVPAVPNEIGWFDTPGYAVKIFLSNEYIYIVDMFSGLWVLSLKQVVIPDPAATYRIRGHVRDANGSGVADTVMNVYRAGVHTATIATDDTGAYEITGLPQDNYTVTPEKQDMNFEPLERAYAPLVSDMNDQDYTAYSITVDDDINDDVTPHDSFFNVQPGDVLIRGGEKGHVNPAKDEDALICFNASEEGLVTICLYTMQGRLVKKLEKHTEGNAGDGIIWDCTNRSNETVSSGIYIAHVTGPGLNKTKKIAVIK